MSQSEVARPAFPRRPLSFIAYYLWRHRVLNAGVLAAVVAATLLGIGTQYGMKLLVDALMGHGAQPVWVALGCFLAATGVENLCWRASGMTGSFAFTRLTADLRLDLFHHLTGHAASYFADRFAGALANKINAAANAVHTILCSLAWSIIPKLAQFVGAGLILASIDSRIAGAMALAVLAISAAAGWVGLRSAPLHEAHGNEVSAVGGELVDVVSNAWSVRAFAARGRERTRLAARLGSEAKAHRLAWLYMERLRMGHDLTLWAVTAGIMLWSVLLWQAQRMTPGDVVMTTTLCLTVLHGSRDLALVLVDLTQHVARISEALDAIGLPHDVVDAPDPRPFRAARGAIRFEGAAFAYPGAAPGALPVLAPLDLEIPAGQRVGIVGASGAGKSTLLAVLQRHYDLTQGTVRIDGTDIRDIAQDCLHRAIAVVPQDIALFHRSIAENIRYGRPDATDAEVAAAARAAAADGFIDALPLGYGTLVGERGIKLSGGQRQRLGIARAFLTEAPILILDEATSALDTEAEIEIQQALDRLMAGRTVVAVAHRLSTLRGFDRILVMRDGRIVEDGPPAALRRQGGLFARMWALQADQLDDQVQRPAA